ncbi:MAG TPA: hypothetical protein VN944_06615, partial [Nitrospiria bacterium]|nr:hypothetical protein [Nitrospiria bacterium]
MDLVEKQKAELLKILQELKQSVLNSIEYSIENIEILQIDTYFSAEESLERIIIGIERLEEDFQGKPFREKLKQIETRLFFLEERFEETDAEMRQRPARKRLRRI